MPRKLSALGPRARKAIEDAVGLAFETLRQQVLRREYPEGKSLRIRFDPDLTLEGLFDSAAADEGTDPNDETRKALLSIVDAYLEAAEAKARARTVQAVTAFLHDARVQTDWQTVLGGQLEKVMADSSRDVEKIMATESTNVRNVSTLDSLLRTNALIGVADPTVAFLTTKDDSVCEECKRLHLLADGVTPRVWKLSEVGHGYHRRGDPQPKISGLHPHCRCFLISIMPGYGFEAGRVKYKSPDWDEYSYQRQQQGEKHDN